MPDTSYKPCKSDGLKTHCNHEVILPPEDDGDVTFTWNFQRGLLSKRMSVGELAGFVVPHMAAILGMGLLASHPRITAEFGEILKMFVTMELLGLDAVSHWVQVKWHQGDWDQVIMNINAPKVEDKPKLYFQMNDVK